MANSKQQTASGKQQTADSKRQTASRKLLLAGFSDPRAIRIHPRLIPASLFAVCCLLFAPYPSSNSLVSMTAFLTFSNTSRLRSEVQRQLSCRLLVTSCCRVNLPLFSNTPAGQKKSSTPLHFEPDYANRFGCHLL
jgi:hypothetical protein